MRSMLAGFVVVLFSGLTMADEVKAPQARAALQSGAAALSPENTKLQFVCEHMPPKKPDPRTGGFGKFSGKAQVDAATKALKSVSIEIDTNSLFTEFDRLTNHLKSPDFFEVRQYSTAKFESTKIAPAGGKHQITGKLTMHGVTREISFPATVWIDDGGLALSGEFTIDRTQWGINYDPKQVANKVALTVVIGDKTQPK